MMNGGIKDPSVTLESSPERSGIIIPLQIDPERASSSWAGNRPPRAILQRLRVPANDPSRAGRESEADSPGKAPKTRERAAREAERGWEGSVSLPGRERTRRSQRG